VTQALVAVRKKCGFLGCALCAPLGMTHSLEHLFGVHHLLVALCKLVVVLHLVLALRLVVALHPWSQHPGRTLHLVWRLHRSWLGPLFLALPPVFSLRISPIGLGSADGSAWFNYLSLNQLFSCQEPGGIPSPVWVCSCP